MKKSLQFWGLLSLFMVVALSGVGIYQSLHREKPAPVVLDLLPSRNPVSVPIGGPFQLIDHKGRPCTEKSFPGKYLIVYFGYTYCPDICPMALQTLSQLMDKIDPQGKKFQPLFITVDPERDTVENLALYAENFHPTFVMLTGSKEKIQSAMKAFRVYASRIKKEDTTEDLIDHSSVVVVITPEGEFITHFHHTTPLEEMIGAVNFYPAS
jgi:cytochrome oxidase Cu insertion factor (SCO1/SenC/PrrC family)